MGATPSPRAAVVYRLICAAAGVGFILGAFGILPTTPSPGVPMWLAGCAGLCFVLMGAVLIVSFAIAPGRGPDGGMAPCTSFAVRVINYFLGLGLVGSITAVFTWIAFGPGERGFSSGVSLPFLAVHGPSGETVGRIMFGIGAVLMWLFLVSAGRERREKPLARSAPLKRRPALRSDVGRARLQACRSVVSVSSSRLDRTLQTA